MECGLHKRIHGRRCHSISLKRKEVSQVIICQSYCSNAFPLGVAAQMGDTVCCHSFLSTYDSKGYSVPAQNN